MYSIKEVGFDELCVEEWNDLLSRSEICDAFQTYEWAQVQKNSMNVEPYFLMVRNRRESVGGALVIKKKMMEVFDSYEIIGGPLYTGLNKAIVMYNLLTAFRKKKNRAVYTLFVPSPLMSFREMFKTASYHLLPLRTIFIDLKKPMEDVWRAFGKDARKGVRKAGRSGVIVKIASSWQEWEEYYKIHVAHSRKKHYSPYPFDFFKEMFKLRNKLCLLFVAKYEKRTIAGKLCLFDRNRVISIQSASLGAFLRLKPNDLVQWRSLEWAAENGFAIYDFHGLPERNAYLRGEYRYKMRWDGCIRPYDHFFCNRLALIGVHLIRRSFLAWKLLSHVRSLGVVQR